jgi:hypothetical protein
VLATVVSHQVVRGQLQFRVIWADTWVSAHEYADYKNDVQVVRQTRQTGSEVESLVKWKKGWETCRDSNWPQIKPYVCLYAGTVADAYCRYHDSDGTTVYLCKWSKLTALLWTPENLAIEYLDKTTLSQLKEAELLAPASKKGKNKKKAKRTPKCWDSSAPNKKRKRQ